MPPASFRSILVLLAWLSFVGFPPATVSAQPLTEDCDNCVDDDGDQLVDRADVADCPPLANGGGVGIGDAARGKALFKCHKGIEKAGLAFSSKRLKHSYACLLPAFACVQTKNGDAGCLTKAGDKCNGQVPGALADLAKLKALIVKACDPTLVADADLDAASGLGLDAEEAKCLQEGSPTDDSIGSFADCLVEQHVCHADRGVSAAVPRARELLLAIGRSPDTELPCLAPGSDGAGQGLGDLGKAALKCQKGITKGSLKLGTAIAKALQKCLDFGVACLQQKDADPACLTTARAKCQKLSAKVQGVQKGTIFKILGATTKSCNGISSSQLQQSSGLGFTAQSARCGDLGIPQFGTQGTITCAGVQEFCEAKQMLNREVPRLEELLTLLNVQIIGL